MGDDDLIKRYNYDSFVPDNFMPWMRFETSPALGDPAPDYPLWTLDDREVSLTSLWSEHLYAIVEFGSYT